MAMIKWLGWPTERTSGSSFSEMERFRGEMDRLFGGLTAALYRGPTFADFPLMNVTEKRDNFYLRAELPGLKANDIDMSITGKSLTISGERKIPAEDEKAIYHRRERDDISFRRTIVLPSEIDQGKVEARYADGVLTVVLPKAEEAKPKRITVK